MKFTLTSEYTYPWPVKIILPDPKRAGAKLTQEFVGTFRYQLRDEAEKLDAELAALPAEEQGQRKHDMIKEILVGWDEAVVDEDGMPIPFSDEALAAAMKSSLFIGAVYRAYGDSISADKARKGN